jgi:predicted RNA-binding Zn-ribbon protein involved in translation (DUF1610 family)
MFGNTMYQHLMKDFDSEIDISYCIDCGEEIIVRKGTNTCRCKECQERYTLVTNRNDMREKYIPVKYAPTRICVNCGAEFSVGSKSKRELCDCCYKKNLRERKTKTMKDLRNRLW